MDKLENPIFTGTYRFFDNLYWVLTICAERAIVNVGCNNFVMI